MHQHRNNSFFFIVPILLMGFNYGQTRNRGEALRTLPGTVLESIGDTDINYSKYDYEETAALTNFNLDRTQARYNTRFNFPPP